MQHPSFSNCPQSCNKTTPKPEPSNTKLWLDLDDLDEVEAQSLSGGNKLVTPAIQSFKLREESTSSSSYSGVYHWWYSD